MYDNDNKMMTHEEELVDILLDFIIVSANLAKMILWRNFNMSNQCIKENATTLQSQEEYNKKYNHLVKRYEKAVDRLNKATADRDNRMQRDRELRIFISSIEKQPLVLKDWDERLWISLLESATVHADNRITFRFKDGTEIKVGAE